jgi:hypothetical protein
MQIKSHMVVLAHVMCFVVAAGSPAEDVVTYWDINDSE